MTAPTLIGERPPAAVGRPGLCAQLLRRKPIWQLVREAEAGHGGTKLVRGFGVLQLTMISVGTTLGTGILVILGDSVPLAGPAIWISFAIAGLAALLSAGSRNSTVAALNHKEYRELPISKPVDSTTNQELKAGIS